MQSLLFKCMLTEIKTEILVLTIPNTHDPHLLLKIVQAFGMAWLKAQVNGQCFLWPMENKPNRVENVFRF